MPFVLAAFSFLEIRTYPRSSSTPCRIWQREEKLRCFPSRKIVTRPRLGNSLIRSLGNEESRAPLPLDGCHLVGCMWRMDHVAAVHLRSDCWRPGFLRTQLGLPADNNNHISS